MCDELCACGTWSWTWRHAGRKPCCSQHLAEHEESEHPRSACSCSPEHRQQPPELGVGTTLLAPSAANVKDAATTNSPASVVALAVPPAPSTSQHTRSIAFRAASTKCCVRRRPWPPSAPLQSTCADDREHYHARTTTHDSVSAAQPSHVAQRHATRRDGGPAWPRHGGCRGCCWRRRSCSGRLIGIGGAPYRRLGRACTRSVAGVRAPHTALAPTRATAAVRDGAHVRARAVCGTVRRGARDALRCHPIGWSDVTCTRAAPRARRPRQ